MPALPGRGPPGVARGALVALALGAILAAVGGVARLAAGLGSGKGAGEGPAPSAAAAASAEEVVAANDGLRGAPLADADANALRVVLGAAPEVTRLLRGALVPAASSVAAGGDRSGGEASTVLDAARRPAEVAPPVRETAAASGEEGAAVARAAVKVSGAVSNIHAPGDSAESDDSAVQTCKDFSDSRKFGWFDEKTCKRKVCVTPTRFNTLQSFVDEHNVTGKNKLIFSGNDCAVRQVTATTLLRACGARKTINIVNVGGSVARGHFTALCELLDFEVGINESNKHQPHACGDDNIRIWHLFLPGLYTTPFQSRKEYETEVTKQKGRCKVHRIWDKRVPYNETALVKLASMFSGDYSPWESFSITDADILFWSSGVWDVAFKQDVQEYKVRLRKVATMMRTNIHGRIVFRTIPRFTLKPRQKECNWAKTVSLVPPYNAVTREIANAFNFTLVDAETIPREDEVYDGIHFSRRRVSSKLTGECNDAISNIFANVLTDWCETTG